ELDHVFECGSAFFQPRLQVFKDLLHLRAKIAATHQVSVFVERQLPGDVQRAPASYLYDVRIAQWGAIDKSDVWLSFSHGFLLLSGFLLIQGLVLRPSGGKAEQAK